MKYRITVEHECTDCAGHGEWLEAGGVIQCSGCLGTGWQVEYLPPKEFLRFLERQAAK